MTEPTTKPPGSDGARAYRRRSREMDALVWFGDQAHIRIKADVAAGLCCPYVATVARQRINLAIRLADAEADMTTAAAALLIMQAEMMAHDADVMKDPGIGVLPPDEDVEDDLPF